MFAFGNKQSKDPSKPFKQVFSLQERTHKRNRLQQKYKESNQNFKPVVIEGVSRILKNSKDYYLMCVENGMTVIYVINYLRKALEIDKRASLFLYVGSKLRHMNDVIEAIHKESAEEDGFLYLTLRRQDTF